MLVALKNSIFMLNTLLNTSGMSWGKTMKNYETMRYL